MQCTSSGRGLDCSGGKFSRMVRVKNKIVSFGIFSHLRMVEFVEKLVIDSLNLLFKI